MERTRSIALATVSGAWSAVISVLILLAVACSLNFALGSRAELHLHEAFLASGMSDPDAFLVKNSLEAASEALVRIPVLGMLLSFAGALGNDWMSRRPRIMAYAAAWLLPLAFAGGAISLWYADSLQRAARPPFILIGLILASISLAGALPFGPRCADHRGNPRCPSARAVARWLVTEVISAASARCDLNSGNASSILGRGHSRVVRELATRSTITRVGIGSGSD